MPEVKEPGYFDGSGDLDEDGYLDLFAGAGDAQVVGEASTGYLRDPDAPGRIAEAVPDARIVISLRDPVERAYSNYLAFVDKGRLDAPFPEVLRAERDGQAETNFIADGRYHDPVRRYLETFGEDRVLILLFDEITADTGGVLRRVARFLDVDAEAVDRIQTDVRHNVTGEPRNALAGWLLENPAVAWAARRLVPLRVRMWLGEEVLTEAKEKPPMADEARRMLETIYAPEVEDLETLLGRDLPELRRTWEGEL